MHAWSKVVQDWGTCITVLQRHVMYEWQAVTMARVNLFVQKLSINSLFHSSAHHYASRSGRGSLNHCVHDQLLSASCGVTNDEFSFADVHYYFGDRAARPLHHRFDKASYVYLYRNTRTGTGHLEIANNPGTKHQDAMAGGMCLCFATMIPSVKY
jgi:hypothetical protein